MPDAKVLAKIARVMGPEVVEDLHGLVVEVARKNKLMAGQEMRVDTTVVETNIVFVYRA